MSLIQPPVWAIHVGVHGDASHESGNAYNEDPEAT
jgi:hypothetical protein